MKLDKTTQLKICSYNIYGLNQGVGLLPDLLNDFDIVCVQEHWLAPDSLFRLNELNCNCIVFSSSAMSHKVSSNIRYGRPFGGVATFVKSAFAQIARMVHKSDRYIIISLGDLIIVNLYMPCNNDDEYEEVLGDISVHLAGCTNIVVCGDFNIEFNVSHKLWPHVSKLISSHDLAVTDIKLNLSGMNYTYRHKTLNHKSFIDHFLVSKKFLSNITLNIIDSGLNLSDHSPISLNLVDVNLNLSAVYDKAQKSTSDASSHLNVLRWDKSDLFIYYDNCGQVFQSLYSQLQHVYSNKSHFTVNVMSNYVELLYEEFVNCLKCCDACIIRKNHSFYKAWWDDNLNLLKNKSIDSHKLWLSVGKPKHGSIFNNMQQAKLNYKRYLHEKQADRKHQFTDSLADSLCNKDMKSFWKTWNNKVKPAHSVSQSVDGVVGDLNIADVFKKFFSQVCTPNDTVVHDKFEMEFNIMRSSLHSDNLNFVFDIEDIEFALNSIKRGKASGFDGISIEHFLFAHPIVLSCLKILFNLMLLCGYVPNAFGCGIMIPLIKSNDSNINNSDNYRGLTLSPVISKVFEHVILHKFNTYFASSDLQFGFKAGIGCSDVLFTIRNVIKYFNKRQSTINVAALDISKAFDKISHAKLFNILLKNDVPVCVVDLLKNWYSKCSAAVRWNGCLSDQFVIKAGVRQGGVLSPILFAMYINDLITDLKKSKLGCMIDGIYLGCFLYADDILLLSLSLHSMQLMLNICNNFVSEVDLKFNVKKSVVFRIGPRWKAKCTSLNLNNSPLSFVTECQYLGVTILAGHEFKCSYQHVKTKFYKTFNAIYAKCCSANSEITASNLLVLKCLPVFLYASEAIFPVKVDLLMMNRLIYRAFAKIFHTFDRSIINDVCTIFNVADIHVLVKQRQMRFVNRYFCKHLEFVQCMFNVYQDVI